MIDLAHYLSIRAKALGMTKIDATQSTINIEFRADTPIDGLAIIKLIQSNDGYRMNGATAIRYTSQELMDTQARIDKVNELLLYFESAKTA